MSRTGKTILFISLGIIILFAVLSVVIYFNAAKMVKTLHEAEVSSPDIRSLADGSYRGSFSAFAVAADVKVTVKSGRIIAIEILKQRSGPGYEARDILNRVIAAQSLDVEAVSGATGSSKCLRVAISRALNSKPYPSP